MGLGSRPAAPARPPRGGPRVTDPVVLFFAALAGLALGSFLNVCVARWPLGGSVVRPRSACPACSATIHWFDQAPVVSWFLLRGRCRRCRGRVSPCYPLVETAAAALCLLVVLTRGVSLEAAAAFFFLLVLLGIALTDARFYLIPDQFSLGGAAAGLAWSLAPAGITPGSAALGAVVGFGGMWLVGTAGTWVLARALPGRLEEAGREHDRGRRQARSTWMVRGLAGPGGRWAAVVVAVTAVAVTAAVVAGRGWGTAGALSAGAICAAALAVLVAWAEGLGEEAPALPPALASPNAVLGGGDVKMMALVGAFTGPWGAVSSVFLGALAGVLAYLVLRLFTGTRQLLPFGVFLTVGGAITLWWGEAILSWYLSLSGLSPP